MFDDSTPKKRGEKAIWQALKHADPATYPQVIAQACAAGMPVDHVLSYPLSRKLEGHLGNIAHKNPAAPETTRDERLRQWFQACVDAGANPKAAVESLGEHAIGGFARLAHMKAYACLRWWRDMGVEDHIRGPKTLDGGVYTLATIAFLHGNAAGVRALLPGSKLTRLDALWESLWSKRCIGSCGELARILMETGPVPPNALAGLAKAPVNARTVGSVLSCAQSLVEAGADPVPSTGTAPLLGVVAQHLNSLAGLDILRFFLERGADSLATGAGKPEHGKTALDITLHCFLGCSVHSHLRDAHFQAFAMMARATPRAAFQALFPAERIQSITQGLRGKTRVQSPMAYGAPRSYCPDPEIAAVQALAMELTVPNTTVQHGRMRL